MTPFSGIYDSIVCLQIDVMLKVWEHLLTSELKLHLGHINKASCSSSGLLHYQTESCSIINAERVFFVLCPVDQLSPCASSCTFPLKETCRLGGTDPRECLVS